MHIKPLSLYTIICDEGPEIQQRVEQAMEWLLSPAAKGIGIKLLKDAYALHGKPLQITPTELFPTAYHGLDSHTILLNPRMLAKTSIGGTQQSMSVEVALAHEMTHAGQQGVDEAAKNLNEIIQTALQQGMINTHGLEHLKEKMKSIRRLVSVSDHETATEHVGGFVDKMVLPAHPEMMRLIYADEGYQHYETLFENPAVATENAVADLLNEPNRLHYRAVTVTQEELRQNIIPVWSQFFEVEKRPQALSQSQVINIPWSESLSKPSGLTPNKR